MKQRAVLLFLSTALLFLQLIKRGEAQDMGQITPSALNEILLEEDEFKNAASLELELQQEAIGRGADLENLLRAKFKLINGDLRSAQFYLLRIDDRKSRIAVVKNRYLAIIAFIEGRYHESLEYLNDKKLTNPAIYSQICLLRILNFMVTENLESLKKEKEACLFYTGKTSKTDLFWTDTMIKLKLKDQRGVQKNLLTDVEYILSDDEMARLWLKSGLYLNKEKDLLNLLSLLPESSYQSKRLREIVAFMYLRSGSPTDIQKALSFIDDIDSANAENIKGTINLQNKEYELAFGHFRLALQKKQDSANSLERAIPLAWILNQWGDGLSMLDNESNKSLDPRNKRAIKVAFLIREKRFIEAQKELALLKIDFKQVPPFEVSIMESYVSNVLGASEKKYDKRIIEESTERACRSFDGMSCWLSLQFMQWENLGKTMNRDEVIFSDKEMTLDSLKEKKEIVPLKETISVDQRDIEELDGQNIKMNTQ